MGTKPARAPAITAREAETHAVACSLLSMILGKLMKTSNLNFHIHKIKLKGVKLISHLVN